MTLHLFNRISPARENPLILSFSIMPLLNFKWLLINDSYLYSVKSLSVKCICFFQSGVLFCLQVLLSFGSQCDLRWNEPGLGLEGPDGNLGLQQKSFLLKDHQALLKKAHSRFEVEVFPRENRRLKAGLGSFWLDPQSSSSAQALKVVSFHL